MKLDIYVPDEVGEAVKRKAEAAGMTVCRYLAGLVQREVAGGWPPGFFENVVGGWQGRPLKRPPQAALERREDLPGMATDPRRW